jgi:hypothetical protein
VSTVGLCAALYLQSAFLASDAGKGDVMRTRALSLPEMMFIVGTRAALAAGVALLLSDRLKPSTRRATGWALTAVGILSTVPAVKIGFGR